MEQNVFDQPVWGFVGLNYSLALKSVAQAHSFLLDTPGTFAALAILVR